MAGQPNRNLLLRVFVPLCLCAKIAALGCSTDPEPAKPVAAAPTIKVPAKRSSPKSFQPPPIRLADPPKNTSPAAPPLPEKSLSDLAARAAAEEFQLPKIDDARAAAAGIRKLTGKHLVLYTVVRALGRRPGGGRTQQGVEP